MKSKFITNIHLLIPVLLAICFVVICIKSVEYKSNTRDESRHLVRGIMLLETGDFRLNKHHPPLANVIAAIPYKFNDSIVIPDTESSLWQRANKDGMATHLVEINGGKRPFVFDILNPSRVMLTVTVALASLIMAILVFTEYGPKVGTIFSLLYFLSPNIIANSRLVTTDALIVPLGFLATFALYKYFQSPDYKRLAIFTLLSFCSLITKFSIIPIAALWIILLFVFTYTRLHKAVKQHRFKTLLKSLGVPLLVSVTWVLLLTASFGFKFDTLASTNHADTARTTTHLGNIADITQGVPRLTRYAQKVYLDTKLPFPEYLQGFFENVLLHDRYGHDSYLFGQYDKKGWWYFFPATMAIKMPIPALIGIMGLVVASAVVPYQYFKLPPSKRKKFRDKFFRFRPQYIFVIVPLFYFLISMKSSINLGIRHILIIFPFLYLGMALLSKNQLYNRLLGKIALVVLCMWYVVSSFSIFPHYLQYFNEFVGGPQNGYKYLLDSNLTWAQDDFYVEDWIENYKGELPVYRNPHEEVEEGIVVIDVDRLMGRSEVDRFRCAWIREPFLKGDIYPIDRINYTYMVFEIMPD